ncbi:MAG: DUF6166 domain-containing protein [bacterium]|nr:DUF6166 domain-containing protein [bacterium]
MNKPETPQAAGGKWYRGQRLQNGDVRVQVAMPSGHVRPLRHHVRHSPSGLEWGYGGSGPSDLARSILINCVGRKLADRHYMQFKFDFVARWSDSWEISEVKIREWLAAQEARIGGGVA